MDFSKNYNIPEMPSGPVEWPAIFNTMKDLLEAGRTIKITAGEALTAGQPVKYPDSAGNVYKAKNTDPLLGIVKADIALAADGHAYSAFGNEITNSSWAWTAGGAVYVGTVAGTLTQTKPSPEAIPIAFANTVTSIVLLRPPISGISGTVKAIYDFATLGGAIGTIGLGVIIPINTMITRAWYEVLTTCVSATDAATIALSIPTDGVGGIVAAIAIDDVSNPWDAGIHETIQTGPVANFSVKTTAPRELSIDIAVEVLTAGKFVLFADYAISE